jgi:4-amino-4-deoxychorismate lyase
MSAWYRLDGELRRAMPFERACQYGDGLFETIAVRGGRLRLWDYHADRLERGAARLGYRVPLRASLKALLEAAIARSGEDPMRCIAKLVLAAVGGERGYRRTLPAACDVYIGVFASTPVSDEAYEQGIDIGVCETRLATGSAFAGLKTLNRLEQVMGSSEAGLEGLFEGLMLDADERLICGTMSNVFIVRDDEIETPVLRRCGVAGVMRRVVLEQLEAIGRPARECDLDIGVLDGSDEVFITNSQFGVLPVRRCAGRRWPIGSVTSALLECLPALGIDEYRP